MKWFRAFLARWTHAKIKREVKRRRRKADTSGLTSKFVELAQNVFYYPAWIVHSRSAVPALVTQAREIKRNRVELITTTGRTLNFERKDTDSFSDDTDTTVQLHVDGSLSFEIEAKTTGDAYAEYWSRVWVTAFIEGPWESDILTMARQQRAWSKSVLKQAKANSVERDRKRFGL